MGHSKTTSLRIVTVNKGMIAIWPSEKKTHINNSHSHETQPPYKAKNRDEDESIVPIYE